MVPDIVIAILIAFIIGMVIGCVLHYYAGESKCNHQFEEILKRSERFTQTMNYNGLGFAQYMKDLLDENTGVMQRNMKISNKVKQLIEDGIVTEKCE
mgnify:CR=1 FL=1